jgi:hypothetical protein
MNIVDRRDHPHHGAGVERHDQMVTGIGEELARPARIDRTIEDAGSDLPEHRSILRVEQADFNGHGAACAESARNNRQCRAASRRWAGDDSAPAPARTWS